MPAAVVGGAIAAAGAVGGAALSSKAQKKAAKKASQAQLDATAQNNALAREQYGKNEAALAPWQQRGNAAGAAMNALLGLGGPAPIVGNGPSNGMGSAYIGNGTSINGAPVAYGGPNGANGAPLGYGGEPVNSLMYVGTNGVPQGNGFIQTTAPTPQTTAANPNQQYQDAFANYRNSTGYQFRVGEGTRALDNTYASRGVGQSGAAAKALEGFRQNIASDEFGNYLNQLYGISNQGLSAANAQAGVGTNLVNALSNNNQNAADAISNAALLRGQANGNLYAGIGGALGNLGGLFGSSFGGGINAASQRLIASNPSIF